MGMNMILTLIVGIVMTTMVGTQVAPSIIEQTKTKKVQTQTINNQEVIFEATKRYITMKQDVPAEDFIGELIKANYIDEKVNDNGFSGTYEVSVDKALGVATITTTIVDPKAQEVFLNSFTSMSKPTCTGTIDVDGVCDTNEFKTKFVLPNEVMHGNNLLMTGIPIQATPPDPNEAKYWYDTNSGKAILKIYDKDSSSWVEVNLGSSSDEMFLPSSNSGHKLYSSGYNGISLKGGGKVVFEAIPSKSGTLKFFFTLRATVVKSEYVSLKILLNGKQITYLNNYLTHQLTTSYTSYYQETIAFKANDKIEITSSVAIVGNEKAWLDVHIYTDPNTIYPISCKIY